MATIINTPSAPPNNDGGAGWSVAVILLIVLIGLGAYFLFFRQAPAPAQPGGTNVNVTIPAGTQGSSGSAATP